MKNNEFLSYPKKSDTAFFFFFFKRKMGTKIAQLLIYEGKKRDQSFWLLFVLFVICCARESIVIN